MGVSNVTVGKPKKIGAVSVAAVGTALPSDATTEATGFTNLGYISEDGMTHAREYEAENLKAWGGDVVCPVHSGTTYTFHFTLLEHLSLDVQKFVHGEGNVTGTADSFKVVGNADDAVEHAMVIDVLLRDGAVGRFTIPRAVISEIGEQTYKDDEAVGEEVTITALPDANGDCFSYYVSK